MTTSIGRQDTVGSAPPTAVEHAPATFVTLEDATRFVDDRVRTHGNVIASENWRLSYAGQHTTRKTGNIAMRKLGVSMKAARFCEKVAPGGKWILVEHEEGRLAHFMAYYTRYLPYALGMCMCESEFPYDGIDDATMYRLTRSFMGFVDLGLGQYKAQNELDSELYSECYEMCNELLPPKLPFDEAINPASVFAFIQNRDWFMKHVAVSPTDHRLTTAIKVVNELMAHGSARVQQLIKPFDRTST